MKVTQVRAQPGFKLHVVFDDSVSGTIDLKSFVKNGVFSILQREELFNKVYTNGYSIAWSDELEIDAVAIYAEILNKSPREVLDAQNLHHAAN